MVLYLVNAAEAPEDAGYLDAELTVLDLIGKPVIVLLNQLGPPRAPADGGGRGAALAQAHCAGRPACATCWRSTPSRAAGCRKVRCCAPWAPCCRAEQRAAFERLRAAWQAQRRRPPGEPRWRCSPNASRAPRSTARRSTTTGCTGKLREVGAALGLRRDGARYAARTGDAARWPNGSTPTSAPRPIG